MIFLCVRDPKEKEFHIKFEGHETVESGRLEITTIREQLLMQGKKPFDCYVYESDEPLYGQRAYELDQIDFNFYQEKTEEEIKASMDSFNAKVAEIKKLAEEEQKKFGGKKVK